MASDPRGELCEPIAAKPESHADRTEKNRLWRIRENEQHRQDVCDWLTANGINPARVPQDTRPSIADGKLTLPLFVVDDTGCPIVDPVGGQSVLMETVTVPVAVPPTPSVEVWLTSPCPTCGR